MTSFFYRSARLSGYTGRPFSSMFLAGTLFIIGGIVGCSGSRTNNTAAQRDSTAADPAPVVQTCQPIQEEPVKSITLPGELVPFYEVDMYAKVSGFVQKVLVDRGSEVKQGQLLAVLVAPELGAQMAESSSKLNGAKAIYRASLENYRRMLETSRTPGTISENDLDQADSKMQSDSALVVSDQSAYESLAAIENYLQVTAPFDGVISERNISPGDLVGPEEKGSSLPMFKLKQENKLRLTVAVPEAYTGSIPTDQSAQFSVDAYPGRLFTGKLAREAKSLTQDIRSEMIEFDVYNSQDILKSGMYAEVNLRVQRTDSSMYVPATAVVSSTEGVFIIRVDGQHIAHWIYVHKGNQVGSNVEIWGPVSPKDNLVLQASDQIHDGQSLD